MSLTPALERIAQDAARGKLVFPSHAKVVLAVRRALDDPDLPLEKLCHLISAEPMLSARMVSVANSVAYRRTGPVVVGVRNAVTRLGFRNVRTMATAFLVRMMRDVPTVPAHRDLTRRLWEHSVHVAALARAIAQRVVRQDPDAAFFAGIVHDAGAFYLVARAGDTPGLIDEARANWEGDGESLVGGFVLREIDVPADVQSACEELWRGRPHDPPFSLGDVLGLADRLVPVASPFARPREAGPASVAGVAGPPAVSDMLKAALADADYEVKSLVSALSG